ncbi:hypothetical protein LEP1GSC163_0195 [Leptospira santarosai str. CBC379]|nr:hypothetical protein LEP1GSC163_0195 [Leptospira santarosai str. CBC379]EMO12512.1 hypothetical protein LEP1GSC165_0006 [Leptospira santarosai str. CBC523]
MQAETLINPSIRKKWDRIKDDKDFRSAYRTFVEELNPIKVHMERGEFPFLLENVTLVYIKMKFECNKNANYIYIEDIK